MNENEILEQTFKLYLNIDQIFHTIRSFQIEKKKLASKICFGNYENLNEIFRAIFFCSSKFNSLY